MQERLSGGAAAFCLSLVTVTASVVACGNRGNLASRMAREPSVGSIGLARCTLSPSQLRPLIVEWTGADRGSLELRLGKGLVVVRYEGCALDVLRECMVPGKYAYTGYTRKHDTATIKDADELYARLPFGAAKLEAQLERSGELHVDMTLVGMLEAERIDIPRAELSGSCEGATHLISGAQLGSFLFYAGANAIVAVDGEALVSSAGLGASSTASHRILNADGTGEACATASTADKRAPEGCSALLRIELVPLASEKIEEPTVGRHRRSWRKSRCPKGMVFVAGGSFDGHSVADACLDMTEVTVEAFGDSFREHQRLEYCNATYSDRASHPMNCITYEDAEEYCESVGKRLPTEWEWEWAARGRDAGRSYPWGEAPPTCAKAVIDEETEACGREQTWPVGSKPAGDSRDGIKDMVGNVWEWMVSPEEGRVLRGGGGEQDGSSRYLKVSSYATLAPTNWIWRGFRCARSAR